MTTDQSSVIKSSARLRNGVVWGVSDVVWLIGTLVCLGMGYSALKAIVYGFLNKRFVHHVIDDSWFVGVLFRLPRVGINPLRNRRHEEPYSWRTDDQLIASLFFNWAGRDDSQFAQLLFTTQYVPGFLLTLALFLIHDLVGNRENFRLSLLGRFRQHRLATWINVLLAASMYDIACFVSATAWVVFDSIEFHVGSSPVTKFGLNSRIAVYSHAASAILLTFVALLWYSELLRRFNYWHKPAFTVNCQSCGYPLPAVGAVCPECGPNPRPYRRSFMSAVWKPTLVCVSVTAVLLCSTIWLSWLA